MTESDKTVVMPPKGAMDSQVPTTSRRTFPGGVHPKESKYFTENRPISAFTVPRQVSVLLTQHIGAVCDPVVEKRQQVQAGQIVGDIDAFVSAPVHSPVNGKVKDIALQSHPILGRAMAVVIEADPEANRPVMPDYKRFGPDFDPGEYSVQQICNAVRHAGIVGMGGAGFPTRVKIEPNPKVPKHMIIINGCECEPFITCDYRLMLEASHQILAGIQLACRVCNCTKVRIGIEDNKPKAIAAMTQALAESKGAAGFEVVALKTKYPQGGERQLIKTITGRFVPTGGIPPQIGVVVLNVATCAAIAEAVAFQTPLTHRVVTVTGCAIAQPGNYYIPVGTSVSDIIDFCGGLTDKAAKVVMGGPMTGFAIAEMSSPITKTTGSLTFLTKDLIFRAKYKHRETACIRCGRCLEVCPERINPTKIAHSVKYRRLELAQQYYMTACIECGCCSYVCPANIELTGFIKTGKLLLAREQERMAK